jgi:hypothetical protein
MLIDTLDRDAFQSLYHDSTRPSDSLLDNLVVENEEFHEFWISLGMTIHGLSFIEPS